MAVDLIGGYLYKVCATTGLAAEVPTLILGQIGWDTDTKTFRVGDDTTTPPRIPTTKSTGSFNFETADFFRFSAIQMVNGGRVDGVDISTMNQSDGFVTRRADGQFENRILTSGDDTLSIVYPDGLDGNPDLRVSEALIASLTPPTFWVTPTEPQDARVGDFWLDTDGPDDIPGNTDDGVVYIRCSDGNTEYWTQISNEYQSASETQVGLTRYATTAEAIARTLNTVALTPRNITALIGSGIDYRTVLNATLTAPPSSPAVGDAYLVPVGASGAWEMQVGKIATWDGNIWVYNSLRVGAMVVDANKALGNASRYLKQTAALTWNSLAATETSYGVTRHATLNETREGVSNVISVTPAGLSAYARPKLPGLLQLYVRIDGNDNNDGLSNTPSSAFRQPQAAVNAALRRYDSAGQQVVINLSNGAYGPVLVDRAGPTNIKILGNLTNPELVVIEGTTGTYGDAVLALAGSHIQIEGVLAWSPVRHCFIAYNSSSILFKNVHFGLAGEAHMSASGNSLISPEGNYVIAGGAMSHMRADLAGLIQIDSREVTIPVAMPFTSFANVRGGYISTLYATFVGAGVTGCTGERYRVEANGTIFTPGGGANFFPGDFAGSVVSGVYI